MFSLPAESPSAAGKVRSFLAGQQQNDVDLLRSLRGHSLDTLQRQLAGLAVSQVSSSLRPHIAPGGVAIACLGMQAWKITSAGSDTLRYGTRISLPEGCP